METKEICPYCDMEGKHNVNNDCIAALKARIRELEKQVCGLIDDQLASFSKPPKAPPLL
jgi:hypothetical protein